MKRLLLLLIPLLTLSPCIQAKKVPGYMGLKFSLQYQAGLSPQWNNLYDTYVPYFSHNVQMGYVVSRKYEVGLQYTRIDYKSSFPRNLYTYYPNTSQVAVDHRDFTGNNVMLYMKFFRARKGFIAPLGRYYLLGLSYQNSRDKFHVTADDNSAIGVPNYTIVQSHDLALTVGVGRNIILFNRMLLTIEGDVNIPLTSGIRAALNKPGYAHVNADAYKRMNGFDAMLVNLVQIKIGLGALVF